MPFRFGLAVGALALAHVGLALGSSWRKSVTIDEAGHVAAGASLWRTGDVRLYPDDPPLVRMIATSPFLVLGPEVPLEKGWNRWDIVRFQEEFVRANGARYPGLVRAARIPVAVLGAITVVLVGLAGLALAGPLAGIAGAAFLAFEPTFAAHAGLATVHVGAACRAFLWLARVRRAAPTAPRLILAGLAGGAAAATKFSALILAPYVAVLVVLHARRAGWRGRAAVGALSAFAVLGIVGLDAGYLFQTLGPRAGRPAPLSSAPLSVLESPALRDLPLPIANRFLEGVDKDMSFRSGWYGREVGEHMSVLSFLRGILVKWTLPALALGIAMLASKDARRIAWPGLWFFAVASLAQQMYGLRFVLPAVPFLAVAIGVAASQWSRAGRARAGIAAALLSCHAAAAVLAAPDLISYQNLAGPAIERLGEPLQDSDMDWGQDLPALKRFQEEEGVEEIPLLYFGAVDPSVYGVHWRYPDSRNDRGWVAVSVAYLRGQRLHLEKGRLPEDLLALYRAATPARLAGGSIALFRWPPPGE